MIDSGAPVSPVACAVPRARRFRFTRPLLELLYNLRTEGDSPGRLAAAVGVGVFVGLTPFMGAHLVMCVLLARLFRLNQIKTYLAAHLNMPLFWPFVLFAEVQAGRLLRGAPPLPFRLNALAGLQLGATSLDLLAGCVVVGAAVGLPLALLTYLIASRRRPPSAVSRLIDETSRRYIDDGVFSWEFVRGKLRHDPLYFALLARGGLPASGRLLDLGCGRGILLALLTAARAQAAGGAFPAGWPPPPAGLVLHGIESRPRIARAAQVALGEAATVEVGDLRHAPLPQAEVVYLLDVLHYLPAAEQEALLDRVAAAIPAGGQLVLREADAAGGAAFTRTRAAERLCAVFRGHFAQRFCFRSAADWRRLLAERGFAVVSLPMAGGTPYANVLIEGRKSG